MRKEGRKLRGEDRFKRRVQEEPQVGEAQDVEIMAWKTIHLKSRTVSEGV